MKKQPMTEAALIRHSKKWDRTGIVVSVLCIIHCFGTPALLIFYPAVGHWFHSAWVHGIFLFSVFAVAGISFVLSYKKHRIIFPLLLGVVGVTLLVLAYVLGEVYHVLPAWVLTSVGGAILIFGHFWNIRACHCYCEHDCKHPEHQAQPQ